MHLGSAQRTETAWTVGHSDVIAGAREGRASRALALATAALGALLAAACGAPEADSPTPTPPPTATIVPTATPTAAPLQVTDDLRGRRERAPAPEAGAPCGVVDLLDAPLGPPDGEGYTVRWPFGRVSRRYNGKMHAGEDWRSADGQSLGKPVHAIGHGQVVYAEPWGWNADKGVVIVRHVIPGIEPVLSFYGHLDPPSVTIQTGACVTRGQQVGAIGDPVTSPHLHFEIRRHMPDQPGPGYWPTDPIAAGWLNPTELILSERLRSAPGVLWTASITETLGDALVTPDGTLLALAEERRLLGLDAATGAERWPPLEVAPARALALDEGGARLYAAGPGGLTAYELFPDGRPPSPVWTAPGSASRESRPLLAARPGGGALYHDGRALLALDAEGGRLWARDDLPAPSGWYAAEDLLVLAAPAAPRAGADDPLVAVAEAADAAPRIEQVPLPGQPAPTSGGLLLRAADGIWHLPGEGAAPRLALPLEPVYLDEGQLLPTADGGALLGQRDGGAMRLVALAPDGERLWDREVSSLSRRLPALIAQGDRAYAVTLGGDILALDPAGGPARRLLAGRYADASRPPWVAAGPAGTLFVRAGDTLVAFDPAALDG